MNYLQADLMNLINVVPFMRLTKYGSASYFLENILKDGLELKEILLNYPYVKYEPLDFYYVLFQSLGVLDEKLVFDLTNFYTWRGVIWASLLVSIAPNSSYKSVLVESKASCHSRSSWAIDLAISEIDNQSVGEFGSLKNTIKLIRELIQPINLPKVKLRNALSDAELIKLAIEHETIREIYKSKGTNEALVALREFRKTSF